MEEIITLNGYNYRIWYSAPHEKILAIEGAKQAEKNRMLAIEDAKQAEAKRRFGFMNREDPRKRRFGFMNEYGENSFEML